MATWDDDKSTFKIKPKSALLIIDVQNDFLPGGSLAVPKGHEIIPVIQMLRNLPWDLVVLSQDWHPANHSSFASNNPGAEVFKTIQLASGPQVMWPDHCVQNTSGADFAADLYRQGDEVVQKGTDPNVDSYSAFMDNDRLKKTRLKELLDEKGIEEVYIVGLATDYCVKFTANDALDLKLRTIVITDACAGINEADCQNAFESLKSRGAVIATSADFLEC